jgi:DsbC/DsbD-like thiol-disulfide interchange protein
MVRAMKAVAALLSLALAPPALAFSQDDILTGQFLSGWRMENGHQMAALSLSLSPGWKTYWRAPGEAGIPPEFDWSGSENIRSVRWHWPSPSVFHSNGLQTVGYHDALVLPVEITPIDPARPVKVSLHVDLGVCNDICMPASLAFSASLLPATRPDAAIRAALEAGPRSGGQAGLKSISCTVQPISDGLRLTARIDLPQRAPDEVVVFETADRRVWVSEAMTARDGGTLVSSADLVPSGGGPFALDRQGVTVTVLGGGGAVEIAGCPAP